ncbi:glycosylphosphatidylinositol anchor attachment 1 protein [Bacillus rossius redtenbacheri]|uniref:glycosylphosphatidylinositol anchor attachment 1 protein n=1 Tax=Bacillus rossius redtenbacheri TaxID=93214 RepID=UPI002FDD6749
MGLLTDPGSGRGKLTQLLVTHYDKLCIILYVGGIVWFMLLAHEHFNAGTYFSENALLPGLVKGDFDEDVLAKQYHSELLEEAARYPDGVPYPWLLAKFRQLSLDTYTHNFTLHYPLGHGTKYTGKNVYAIMRAPRSASTEALVLSVPYRPLDSIHPTTAPSVALMMCLAKFFRRQKYWAKDVIFLVTEHEQLGMQAWLEAYHRTSCGRPGVLDHGDMMGRGGAIQAAINLELHSEKIGHVDVKVEGLNGQLPNLDLVNLVHRLCSKEGVRHTFKNRDNLNHRNPVKEWLYHLKTLMAMVSTQATGVPNGNHGLFHRFGIEAVTLEGFEKRGRGSPAVFYQLGRVMEGLFRSLNNLLERFHQSYFFYLQPATDRYISIGMYMPPLGLLCAALLVKAFGLWLRMHEDPAARAESTASGAQEGAGFSVAPVGVAVLSSHALGVALLSAPQTFAAAGLAWAGLPTDASLYLGYLLAFLAAAALPLVARSSRSTEDSWTLLYIVALLELATLLLAVAVHNFSLALVTAVLYVPCALGAAPARSRLLRAAQRLAWLALHPLPLLTAVVGAHTAASFPEEPWGELCRRALHAARQALVFAVVDGHVYGSWAFGVATAALAPAWLLFWLVVSSRGRPAGSS